MGRTPGPWRVGALCRKKRGSPTIPIVAEDVWIADVLSGELREGEINAQLMAAAPELLASHKALLAWIEQFRVPQTVVDAASQVWQAVPLLERARNVMSKIEDM